MRRASLICHFLACTLLVGTCILGEMAIPAAAQTSESASRTMDVRESPAILRQLQEQSKATGQKLEPEARVRLLSKEVGLLDDSSLRHVRSSPDGMGRVHHRYERLFRGVPVWGEEIVVTADESGAPLQLYGVITKHIEKQVASTTPTVPLNVAVDTGRAMVRREYGIAPGLAFSHTKARLIIFPKRDQLRLAYEVELFAELEGQGDPTNRHLLLTPCLGH